ncbi:hypothetical protein GGF37_000090 [Kickxella alabastrina]|nr:hypothetical protein GGF37_000090 [Kickxella alabastrina]
MVNLPIPQSLDKECIKAAKILNSFVTPGGEGTDKFIPPDILANAKGIAFLTVLKAGFIWSGRIGTGLVVARLPDGTWSAPSAINTAGAGVGGQIGAEMTDFVMILTNDAAVKSFSHGGNVTLGANLTVAAGPYGRGAEASGTIRNLAPVLSYSKSRGLFAGVSLEGSAIFERKDANERMYGRRVRAHELMSGAVAPPPQADVLYRALDLKAARLPNDTGDGASVYSGTASAAGAGYAAGAGTYGAAAGTYGAANPSPYGAAAGTYGAANSSPYGAAAGTYGAANSSPYGASPSPYGAASNYGASPALPAAPDNSSYLNRSLTENIDKAASPAYGAASNYGASSSQASPAYGAAGYHSAVPGSTKAGGRAPPPPPPPRPNDTPAGVRAVANYDFNGTEAGDLSFTKGDIITVTEKKESQNDWWEGICNGKTGSFPGNYVSLS